MKSTNKLYLAALLFVVAAVSLVNEVNAGSSNGISTVSADYSLSSPNTYWRRWGGWRGGWGWGRPWRGYYGYGYPYYGSGFYFGF